MLAADLLPETVHGLRSLPHDLRVADTRFRIAAGLFQVGKDFRRAEYLSIPLTVAGRLGMTAKAVESLLTRARQAFRDGFAAILEGSTP